MASNLLNPRSITNDLLVNNQRRTATRRRKKRNTRNLLKRNQEKLAIKRKDKDKEGGNGVTGPLSLKQDTGNQDITDFGRALLPGEGEAMAQCVKESKQIPCCGDIKHTNDEIATFESSVDKWKQASSHGSCTFEKREADLQCR
ncbi:NKAP family protein CG6066-like [Pocillopora verrucosa]|uniref:NKAP family protein CG6066-like n=1 Tax=Pocillopora verrucosa TaxID=203993 RepID=UPI00333FBDD0